MKARNTNKKPKNQSVASQKATARNLPQIANSNREECVPHSSKNVLNSTTMSKKFLFSVTPNIKSREITSSFATLEELVTCIRSQEGRPEIAHILKAREHGKGTTQYDEIKKNRLPCVLINSSYQTKACDEYKIAPTGYMYIDIDNTADKSAEEILHGDITHIAAYWRSLSQTGYSIVLKVSGLDESKLKQQYECVCAHLQIEYDAQAVSKNRLTILSYDPDAYYNPQAQELNIASICTAENQSRAEKTKKHSREKNREEENAHNACNNKNPHKTPDCRERDVQDLPRTDNLAERLQEEGVKVIYNDEGYFNIGRNIAYTEIGIYQSIPKGKRNKTLSRYAKILIQLNRGMTFEHFSNFCKKVNRDKCKPPLNENETSQIIRAAWAHRHEEPYRNKTTRFMFDPEKDWSKSEISKIVNATLGKEKARNSMDAIKKAVAEWDCPKDGKMTMKNIAKKSGVCRNTVSKHYQQVLEEIEKEKQQAEAAPKIGNPRLNVSA